MNDNRRRSPDNRGRGGRSDRRNDDRRGTNRGDGGRGNRPQGGRDDGGRSRSDGGQERRSGKNITAGTGQLPKWVRDEVVHSTPKARREAALSELEAGVTAYADERFGKAAGALGRAKDLAPRAATIRELLGLSLYQLERWKEALSELRTYRRLTGSTDHMAVELDCQRALGDVMGADKTWERFNELGGGSAAASDELRVVYASSLLERGENTRAWLVIKPDRLIADPSPSMLRRWAVAARVADANGDRDTARQIVTAIRDADPEIPWLSEYDDLLG